MTTEDFFATLASDSAPQGLRTCLEALWWDRRGKWERAHELVQEGDDTDAALVHAYLHRKEGDIANAGYWYRVAGRAVFRGTLEEEWEALVRELCG